MKEIKKVVTELGEGIVSSIKSNMDSYGQGDSRLAHSLRFEADEEHLTVFAADYFEFAEKGRGPGGTPRNFYDILSDWVSRHHVKFDGEESRFVRAVAWNIYHHGTRLWRNGEVRDFIGDAVEKNMEKFEEDITKSLIEEIKKVTE